MRDIPIITGVWKFLRQFV